MVDSRDGVAYVKRFAHDAAAWRMMRYPEGGSTVAVCTSETWTEIEVLSPEVYLDPGQATTLATTWSACRLAGTLRSVNAAGIVVAPLTAVVAAGQLHCEGSYGVFARGRAVVRVVGSGTILADCPATPLKPLIISVDVVNPAVAQGLELVIITDKGEDILDRYQFP